MATCFSSWEKIYSDAFFKRLVHFTREDIQSWAFLCGKFFVTNSIFCYMSIQSVYLFLGRFWHFVFLGIVRFV